ncbi:unnamed protein product [Paramecium primaurelia]|uniref:Uncharacterized protein n=1 Tax=Paramecium primaurelia TaxID=5886 RepID=A0A8S1QCI5_PARPR|nr:unnamed protein product [Paramecium primaurelia]
MNFLNKIFASSHNRSSFQIEDVSGSEEDQDEIPEHQEIPQFKKQNIQQLQNYNSRKKPLPKMGQADFLAKYDENFEDVFGDKPIFNDQHKGKKRRQEEEDDNDNENDNEKKTSKKKTQSKERKQQSKEQKESQKDNKKTISKEQQSIMDYKDVQLTIDYKEFNDMKEYKEFKEPIEPKIQNKPNIRLPKFPKQRKRIANNHLSTLRSNSDGRDSVSNKDRESIQKNNKYNPNEIALPETTLPKSEKKQDKSKTMFFTFGLNNNNDDDSDQEIHQKINDLFQDQKEKQQDQNEQNSNNQISIKKKNPEKKQKNEEKKEKNEKSEKKQRKEKKEKEKQTINGFNDIKEILRSVNSKQNSEQRETRKLNSEQRDKKRGQKQSRENDDKIITKSPSPEMKLIQYETQKRVKRSQKRVIEDLEMLNVDELSLNPNIVECKPNLYLDYVPVYD